MNKILIVDDEILRGLYIQAILEKHNYNTIMVTSCKKALAAIEGGTVPDLILIDIDPGNKGMDGVETTKKISEKLDIPVVLYSGHTDRETIDKTKAVTKYGYVYKVPGYEMYLTSSIQMVLTLHEMNKSLREQETVKNKSEEYLSIAEEIIVAVNSEGIVTLVNKRACQVLGYERKDIEGKKWIKKFIPERIRKDMMSFVSEMSRGRMDLVEYHENSILTKSGEERIISWHNSLLFDDHGNVNGYLFSGVDITKHKQIEDALRESEKKYRQLFCAAISGFAIHEIILSPSGKPVDYIFLEANYSFEIQTGLQRADILGRKVTDVFPGIEEAPFIEFYGNVVLSGEPISFEQYSEAFGRYCIVNAYRVAAGRFATVFNDITKCKQAEETVQIQQKKLEQKNMALSVMLEQIMFEKRRITEEYENHIANFVLPIINEMQADGLSNSYIKRLKCSLKIQIEPPGNKNTDLTVLSRREAEICNLIRGGLKNKEIASILNIAVTTVAKHRMHIRKKLRIVNSSINLETFLKTPGQ